MSLAAVIVRQAIEASQKRQLLHADRTERIAESFADHLGRPWKFRIDAIRDALAIDATQPPSEARGQDGQE